MRKISVTEALAPFSRYDKIPSDVLEAAKQRGNRIHAAAGAKLSGTFLVSPLLPEDAGYWESLEAWIDSAVEDVVAVELELFDQRLGVVGHPDLIASVHGMPTVCDWKTPQQAQKTWRPQLAGYCYLAETVFKKKFAGMVVQPHPDGSPAKATPFTATGRDLQAFMSALNCIRYFTD